MVILGNHWFRPSRFDRSGNGRYARWQFALFPLTLILSLRERKQRASRSGEPRRLDCSARRAWFALSPRERDGVRGKRPTHGFVIEWMPPALILCGLISQLPSGARITIARARSWEFGV